MKTTHAEVDINYFPAEFRVARKNHFCHECGKEIQKGERYIRKTFSVDGKFFHPTLHYGEDYGRF